jgi:hypothetical protein
MIERIDLEHLLDRRHTRDRFLRELADAEGERTRQLAVEIHRAAAHARNHAGILGLDAVQTDQDNAPLGPFTLRITPRTSTSMDSGFTPWNTVRAVPFMPSWI